ncbi:hypothetical protein J4403_04075 [Candidatus Woesearchaeota archaeon]|nr:hypothetical protein [Candidatus Woesearchaeota archaeon]
MGKLRINKDLIDCADLTNLGFPSEEYKNIVKSLKKGIIPSYIINTLLDNQEINLHPDKYPWQPNVIDDICDDFKQRRINFNKLYDYFNGYISTKKSSNISLVSNKKDWALVNLFERYALLTFYDINKLDITKKEIHF